MNIKQQTFVLFMIPGPELVSLNNPFSGMHQNLKILTTSTIYMSDQTIARTNKKITALIFTSFIGS